MLGIKASVTLETKLLDLCLAMRTLLPTDLRALISTDMDILRREELCHLGKHILQECHSVLLSCAKHIVSYTPHPPYIVWSSCASKFRICSKSSEHMSWKVNLRNNGNSLGCSIFHHLGDLLLSVPEAFSIRLAIELSAPIDMSHESLLTDGSDLCELRIFLDFHAPSLVVCEMPMKRIHFMDLHQIKNLLHLVDTVEMTSLIKMLSSIFETRSILDLAAWKFPFLVWSSHLAINFCRKHLLHCLDCIVEASEIRCLHLHTASGDLKPISLRRNIVLSCE